MKTFFAAMGGAVVGLLLVFAIIAGVIFSVIGSFGQPNEMPDEIVLLVDLRNGLPDQSPKSGLAAIFGQSGFIDTLLKLDAAADDARVKGVFIRGDEMGYGFSKSEELRTALLKLKANNKFIIAHTQGTYGGGPSGLRVLSTADELWIQPGSEILSGGLAFETTFLGGLMERISVTPQIQALYEYKNAPSQYSETTFTDAHRLAMTELGDSLMLETVTDIASDRGLDVEAVRAALAATPMTAEDMITAKLADKTGWPEDAKDAVKARVGDNAKLMRVSNYIAPTSKFGSPTIAIVGGQGAIVTGGTGGDILQGGAEFSSDNIAEAILDAARNDDVEAIVFRVDSPGGSPVASDQIWRAVERAKNEFDKPVIVSMASLAASGGYYVSTGADVIIANRTTITGSIGIFGGKIALDEGLNRLGINSEMITIGGGEFTGALSSIEKFTPAQEQIVNDWLKRGYDRFLDLVAEGRGMTVEEVHDVARGRVWTGADAKERGLVDELGGLIRAIDKAKELAKIEASSDVRIIQYPRADQSFPIGGLQAGASVEQLQALSRLSALMNDPRMAQILDDYEAAQSGQLQARMPSFTTR
jgi:protease-4